MAIAGTSSHPITSTQLVTHHWCDRFCSAHHPHGSVSPSIGCGSPPRKPRPMDTVNSSLFFVFAFFGSFSFAYTDSRSSFSISFPCRWRKRLAVPMRNRIIQEERKKTPNPLEPPNPFGTNGSITESSNRMRFECFFERGFKTVRPLIGWFVGWLIDRFVHSFIRSFARSFLRSFVDSSHFESGHRTIQNSNSVSLSLSISRAGPSGIQFENRSVP